MRDWRTHPRSSPGLPALVFYAQLSICTRKSSAYESQKVVESKYKEFCVGEGYPDLVVHLGREKLIVELKAISGELGASEEQQLRNYLRILKLKRGLLINFQQPVEKAVTLRCCWDQHRCSKARVATRVCSSGFCFSDTTASVPLTQHTFPSSNEGVSSHARIR